MVSRFSPALIEPPLNSDEYMAIPADQSGLSGTTGPVALAADTSGHCLEAGQIAALLENQIVEGARHERCAEALRSVIRSGNAVPGQPLPSERDLAIALGWSRVTVRKALASLITEGLISKKHGAGTFVASRIEKSIAALSSFSEDMQRRELKPGSRLISSKISTVTPQESIMFHLPMDARVIRLERVRLADEQPMAFERVVIPTFAVPDPQNIGPSLYKAMEAAGYRPVRAVQRIRAVNVSQTIASALDVRPGTAALLIERSGVLPDGRVVEFTRSFYRGDSYDLVTELSFLASDKASH
jgi:GntR family transcriptional regulator